MSDLFRITNYELVREVLTSPEIYSKIGDDFTPDVEDFQVNDHPAISYVGVCGHAGLIGMFSLIPINTICWELHVVMLPWARTGEKWRAARVLPGWLARNTECRRLTAAAPACNRAGIIYCTHGIGMRYVGRHPAAFQKGGKLEDLILLGLPINGRGGHDAGCFRSDRRGMKQPILTTDMEDVQGRVRIVSRQKGDLPCLPS